MGSALHFFEAGQQAPIPRLRVLNQLFDQLADGIGREAVRKVGAVERGEIRFDQDQAFNLQYQLGQLHWLERLLQDPVVTVEVVTAAVREPPAFIPSDRFCAKIAAADNGRTCHVLPAFFGGLGPARAINQHGKNRLVCQAMMALWLYKSLFLCYD